MKIGIILGTNQKGIQSDVHHSGYYFSGLSKCPEIKEIYFSSKPHTSYNWFPIDNAKTHIRSVKEIENMNLDFVIYGYYSYIKDNRIPKAKSIKVQFVMRDSIYQDALPRDIHILEASDIIFKISTPKNRLVFTDPSAKPKLFEGCTIPQTIADKIHPLMYVGSHPLEYPSYPFTHKYKISFAGSITSLDRINAVHTLQKKYGKNFIGGFVRDTRGDFAKDEDGNIFTNIKIPINTSLHLSKPNYLKMMKNSTVSFSPAGFGGNTHRFIDILCMGGACLTSDISHIDYGHLGPKENEHYLSYKKDHSDLIEKIEYLLNNKNKAEEMGNRAREFMKQTYMNNEKMAREYILKVLK